MTHPMPFDPLAGQRIRPAWEALIGRLSDGGWHSWNRLVEEGIEASDVQAKTVSNLIHHGVQQGWFRRRGEHRHGTREVQLAEAGFDRFVREERDCP